jgi:hypothetical protein
MSSLVFKPIVSKNHNNNRSVRRRKLMGGNQKSHQKYAHFEEPIPRMFPMGNKAVDQTGNPAYSSSGSVVAITFPAQGTSYSTRVADRCRLTGFEYRTDVFLNSTDTNNPCRIIIFQEIGLSSGSVTTTSVLQTAGVTSALAYNAGKLFHILHDEVFMLNTNSDHSAVYKIIKPSLRIRDIQFTPTTTTPYSGQIYVLTIGGTANLPTSNLYSRLWFADTD